MDNPTLSGRAKLDPLMTVQEVSDHLGIKKQTLYRWRMDRKGPRAIKTGKFLRYRLSEVLAFEESMLDPGAA